MEIGLLLNTSALLLTEPDLSLSPNLAGEPSLEVVGEGVLREKEFARSATETKDAVDGSRTLALRTEKKEADGVVAVLDAELGGEVVVDSFSSALMRCEMLPTPIVTFLAAGLSCWLILFKKAAPAETVRFSDFGDGMRFGVLFSCRSGFEKMRENLFVFSGLGKTGLIGDFDTDIGFAS